MPTAMGYVPEYYRRRQAKKMAQLGPGGTPTNPAGGYGGPPSAQTMASRMPFFNALTGQQGVVGMNMEGMDPLARSPEQQTLDWWNERMSANAATVAGGGRLSDATENAAQRAMAGARRAIGPAKVPIRSAMGPSPEPTRGGFMPPETELRRRLAAPYAAAARKRAETASLNAYLADALQHTYTPERAFNEPTLGMESIPSASESWNEYKRQAMGTRDMLRQGRDPYSLETPVWLGSGGPETFEGFSMRGGASEPVRAALAEAMRPREERLGGMSTTDSTDSTDSTDARKERFLAHRETARQMRQRGGVSDPEVRRRMVMQRAQGRAPDPTTARREMAVEGIMDRVRQTGQISPSEAFILGGPEAYAQHPDVLAKQAEQMSANYRNQALAAALPGLAPAMIYQEGEKKGQLTPLGERVLAQIENPSGAGASPAGSGEQPEETSPAGGGGFWGPLARAAGIVGSGGLAMPLTTLEKWYPNTATAKDTPTNDKRKTKASRGQSNFFGPPPPAQGFGFY